ncbi:abc transporter [Ceraceosorus bombacis]|uniref:Abc transporter n=1 Tax=Ceraceosorus bombacis TaxID=401625 RepID=A0A0P1BSP7_9BASI|nr:abc transporter [Ceraceosorus bombacis]
MSAASADQYPPRVWYRKVPLVRCAPILDPLSQPAVVTSVNDQDVDSIADAACYATPVFPEVHASWLSLLTFGWLSRILSIGYTRPLQADELYSMPEHRRAHLYADKLEQAWERRVAIAKQQSARKTKPGLASKLACLRPSTIASKLRGQPVAARQPHRPSLTLALNEVTLSWFWVGGAFKFLGDMALITSPLLVRAIIDTLGNQSPQAQRDGFGLAIGLFLLLVVSVFGNVHGFYRSYSTGIALRGALIHVIFRRATQLSEKARVRDSLGTGKLMSLVSADVSRIDFCCGYFHMGWTSLLQIIVCLALSIWTLGYSALPGFGLIALLYPLQNVMVRKLFELRRKSLVFTDARIKAIVEAVASIRLIKTYAWEPAVLSRISKTRGGEMGYLRKRLILRSINTAVSFTAPTLAAVVSFVTFSAAGNSLESGKIFSALTFFLLLRTPLQMLPIVLSALADAKAAVDRLEAFLHADLRSPYDAAGPQITPLDRMPQANDMVAIEDSVFAHHDDDLESEAAGKKVAQSAGRNQLATRLTIDSFHVKRGQLACVVGPVGSGKSSLLRALIGDMQPAGQTGTGALLAGKISYCPQTAWLLSASVRDNILFGRPYEEVRYQDILRRCCLHADLATLSHGDETVVGEKGISLSGGQKQRISLARALYSSDTKVRLLDDCFSALDAQVGKEAFEEGLLKGRQYGDASDVTTILVTHSLTLLARADVIFYMDGGSIVEQGTYAQLMQIQNGRLASLVSQHGKSEEFIKESSAEAAAESQTPFKAGDAEQKPHAIADGGAEAKTAAQSKDTAIMQKEERLVGSVTKRTYFNYVLLGYPLLTAPLFIVSIVAYQATTILSPFWLNWWQGRTLRGVSNDTYMAVYAALGVGQSLGLFCMSASFAMFAYYVSNAIHAKAAKRVMHAPISFFDTTPQGRITHRFSKDIDAIDNIVAETLRLFISTTVQALGSIVLVAIILPPFLAIAAFVLLAYVWTGMYYRPSSRELRRLNNLLRSKIYEHFSEALSGLVTLRAYDTLALFVRENGRRIDTENKAYWLSIACQRWLNLRLDMFGAVLCLGTALLVVGLRDTISPGKGGVVLSYMVTVQSVFGQMIRQSAEIENNMNSIERLLYYANEVDQERPHHVKSIDKSLEAAKWPQKGHVRFDGLTASHRKGLAPALNHVNLDIRPGQKIGVVGRTGAGKTTLLSALLRMMEASEGRVTIDDQDVSAIGLSLLRRSISVISQDAVLFRGSLRYNLDPFDEYDDAHLWHALRQAKLTAVQAAVETEQTLSEDMKVHVDRAKEIQTAKAKGLDLDMEILEDGSNLSQGQRALVSIARALVKNARIVVLDEATASVDTDTDAHIQAMLQTSLVDCTVITVAHRLDTVVGRSDAICVMDKGKVAEYGEPAALYRQGGIFAQLCASASINETDIEKAKEIAGRG